MTVANQFSHEEQVAFEQSVLRFDDAMELSEGISKFQTNAKTLASTNDTIWRPRYAPPRGYTGIDQTANFKNQSELSVPATVSYTHSVPITLTAKEMNDGTRELRLADGAAQMLASLVNTDISTVLALASTKFIKRSGAATGFDDVALACSAFDELGVPAMDRKIAIASRHYNLMASSLAGRVTDNPMATTAYSKALINSNVAGFEALKLSNAYRLAAAAGVTCTVAAVNSYYVPKSQSTAATGETSNVDNRYQALTIGVTSGTVKVGDAFTLAGVYSVHDITKQSTGVLQTFRIHSIVSGAGGSGVVQISPPIISATGATDIEKQFQNTTTYPANGSAIVFLNTVAEYVNPFWVKGAIELIPAKTGAKNGAGVPVLTSSTSQGIEIAFQKFYDINTMNTQFRWDITYGIVVLQPEMCGLIMFNQT